MMNFLFDMDGVLVNSENYMIATSIRVLKEVYGIETTREDYIPYIGAGEDKFIGGPVEKHGGTYTQKHKQVVYAEYVKNAVGGVEVFESTLPVIEALFKKRDKLAIVSAADSIKVNANIRAAGLQNRWFGAVITGEDVTEKKPSGQCYRMAAEMLRVEPSACYVVEDAVNGIMAARDAGAKSIGLTGSFTREELLAAGADFVIDDLSEILTLQEKGVL